MRACDETLKKTLSMADAMLDLADEGDGTREDVGCGILYGVLRDSAYKIRRLAEKEREAHVQKGWWNENQPGKGGDTMATFECKKCGHVKDGRCRPQKCPECGEKKTFEKKES